ncbi:MAG: hypothetical protein IJX14_08465, partial [Clostridia bacterium]|nr:hypothetical protein [Clostridia bacterium]
LKFYASVRIDIRKTEALKKGTEVYGNRVKCKVVKNKVAPPFTVEEFDLLYGTGISKSGEVLDMATELGILEKSGAWFYYDGNRIGQGKENARQFLESDPAMIAEIEEKIKAMGAPKEMDRDDMDDDDDEELDIRLLDIDEDEEDDGEDGLDEE